LNKQNDLFKEDFKNAANYAENIYNKILIINSFCSDKKYSEEIQIIKNSLDILLNEADKLNSFFIKIINDKKYFNWTIQQLYDYKIN